MKNLNILFLLFLLPFLGCKNDAPKTEKKETLSIEIPQSEPQSEPQSKPQSKKIPKDIPLPSQEEGVDYWTANNCKRTIPTSTITKDHQVNGYKFKLNPQQGYGKETMFMENGYKLDVTSKGCNSVVLTYSYFLPSSDLDITDEMAVSRKVLELIEMTTKMSAPPFDIKSKLPPLKMAVEQIGPFSVGNEFILSESPNTQKFSIERLEKNKNKVFLVYYFSQDL